MSVDIFLQETSYIDYSSPIVRDQAKALFKSVNSELEKVRIAFEFVRDEISHSLDVNAPVVTAKASDVLRKPTCWQRFCVRRESRPACATST